MPNPKDKPEKEPEKEPEKKPENEPEEGPEKEPTGELAFDPSQLADTMSMLVTEIEGIKQAVAALANEGAVNAAVAEDNGEDYPDIDLDEVNRLIGV